jgi:peptidoglycan/LPS O-acetylase OafA/YrhL
MMARDDHLQSMRGLAALMVMLGHSRFLVTKSFGYPWLDLVLQPASAVIFFFVLSGYVLGNSLTRSPSGLLAFTTKRLFRLVPVMWTAVFIGAMSYLLLEHPPIEGVAPWLGEAFKGAPAVTLKQIVLNMLSATVSLNGTLWSVQVELFMIPVIPLFVMVAARTSITIDSAIVAFLSYLSIRTLFKFPACPVNIVAYLNCFYIGIILPKVMAHDRFRVLFAGHPHRGLLLAISLYCGAASFGLSSAAHLVIVALTSAMLIAVVVLNEHTLAARLLRRRRLVWLGDMSYSFYAYGTAVLMVSGLIVIVYVPQSWIFSSEGAAAVTMLSVLLTLAVLLPIAVLSYRFIEQPFIRWGAIIIGRMERPHSRVLLDIEDGTKGGAARL